MGVLNTKKPAWISRRFQILSRCYGLAIPACGLCFSLTALHPPVKPRLAGKHGGCMGTVQSVWCRPVGSLQKDVLILAYPYHNRS